MKKVTDEILLLFKLAHDLKTRFPEILDIILDSESDKNWFLKYYSNEFKDTFFHSLLENKIVL